MVMSHDTIAAIATAVGEGSIAIIRISGPDAIARTSAIFRTKDDFQAANTHTVHYGHIIDPGSNERVEEVLVTLMRGPRSFTGEDVVEIGTHGGVIAAQNVMQQVLRQGDVRLAEPGEFTKRAFLNGRIDLTQAEAVIDLIRSKSDRAFQVARRQSEGALTKQIKPLRQQILEVIAHVEVNIDYPEHDVEELTSAFIRKQCGMALEGVNRLLKTASEGKILREGIVTAIVGRPNVGKSSLLNALSRSNKAIVTDIPGTTRDVIEEYITINGIPLRLLDTAGIRETSDVVERIGVERSRSALEDADLILFVLNQNEELHDDDRALMDKLADRQVVVILNKMDLPKQLNTSELERTFPAERIVAMSVQEDQGIDRLEQVVSDMFFTGGIETNDLTYVTNVRHISLLERARQSLIDAMDATHAGVPIDITQIDIQQAWELLGEVIGDAAGESLLDQIFSQFCLGK